MSATGVVPRLGVGGPPPNFGPAPTSSCRATSPSCLTTSSMTGSATGPWCWSA